MNQILKQVKEMNEQNYKKQTLSQINQVFSPPKTMANYFSSTQTSVSPNSVMHQKSPSLQYQQKGSNNAPLPQDGSAKPLVKNQPQKDLQSEFSYAKEGHKFSLSKRRLTEPLSINPGPGSYTPSYPNQQQSPKIPFTKTPKDKLPKQKLPLPEKMYYPSQHMLSKPVNIKKY